MSGGRASGACLLVLGLTACLTMGAGGLRADSGLSRKTRGLVYVQGSILQFAYGLQVPAGISNRTVNLNVGLQANYMLPGNVSQLHGRVRRSDHLSHAYSQLEPLLQQHGFVPARVCLLKSICEAAVVPLAGGLLEQLLHIFLTPSEDTSTARVAAEDPFLQAELLGKATGTCELFSSCSISPLQLVSQILPAV